MMNYSDTTIATTTPFLSLENVRKTYPGVVALDGFSMEVRPGEVIGLVGENGAGKSTLMKILGGVTTPDTGTITVDGTAHKGLSVEGSLGSGIAFVHQELNLFENLDVAANIFFGREPLRAGPLKLVDRVVVLRDGMLAGTLGKRDIGHDQMVKLMIGRMLKEREKASEASRAPGAVALAAKAIRTPTYPSRPVDLDVRRGEILGLAGLVGSGRTELARVFFGIEGSLGGTLELAGKPLVLGSAADGVRHGIFLVPEDRKLTGILLDLSIAQNISLPNLPAHAKRSLVSA